MSVLCCLGLFLPLSACQKLMVNIVTCSSHKDTGFAHMRKTGLVTHTLSLAAMYLESCLHHLNRSVLFGVASESKPAVEKGDDDVDEKEACKAGDDGAFDVEQANSRKSEVLRLCQGERRSADVEPEGQAGERGELCCGAKHRGVALKAHEELHPDGEAPPTEHLDKAAAGNQDVEVIVEAARAVGTPNTEKEEDTNVYCEEAHGDPVALEHERDDEDELQAKFLGQRSTGELAAPGRQSHRRQCRRRGPHQQGSPPPPPLV
jgi:hypothetical protein